MTQKRYRPEEIVAKLRQVEVLTAQGKTAVEATGHVRVRLGRLFHFAGGGSSIPIRRAMSRRSL